MNSLHVEGYSRADRDTRRGVEEDANDSRKVGEGETKDHDESGVDGIGIEVVEGKSVKSESKTRGEGDHTAEKKRLRAKVGDEAVTGLPGPVDLSLIHI